MNWKPALAIGLSLLIGASSSALGQEKRQEAAATKDTATIQATVPITDEGLQRIGVKNLKGTDVARMAALMSLLGAARSSGGHGSPYICDSRENACTCHGWLDCVLVMDECRTPPKNPDGTLCTGERDCTCTWH